MKQKVKDFEHLYKIDETYIVNEDEEGYRQALIRHKKLEEEKKMKEKIDSLEKKIDEIVNILNKLLLL